MFYIFLIYKIGFNIGSDKPIENQNICKRFLLATFYFTLKRTIKGEHNEWIFTQWEKIQGMHIETNYYYY